MFARPTASPITIPPRSTAEQLRRAEPYLPTGVLTAETMTERRTRRSSVRRSVRSASIQPAAWHGEKALSMLDTQLLVIGAGPYGLSTAAYAQEHGIQTTIVGHPMSFWREHMPEGMFLRSGVDWHLDAGGVHTLAAFVEDRAIPPQDLDPIPRDTFVDYCDWFRQMKRLTVREEHVTNLAKSDGGFEATLAGGDRIAADVIVCAPGIRHFTNRPDWADSIPEALAAHTCDLVRFEELAGAR